MTLPLGGQVPKDVLQVSNLGTSTQNLNPSKMTDAAKGRMSESFLGSVAGLPGGVATTATNLFGQFAGKIADDNDATTVENPADVNAQVTSFFGNPGTSILDLIFGALISALGGVPIIGSAIQSLAGWLNGLQVDLAAQQATVNDHSQSITELREAFNQLILQGNALVFTSNNTYTPSAGVLSVDVILIGGGAGGAGGTASAFNGGPGGGGGGGGEVHVNIPATLLPKDGEDFASIEITIGAGGARGTVGNPGTGGGDTVFGAGLLTAGGGQGGVTGTNPAPGVGGVGGAGMIPGGAGGSGRVSSGNGWPGGHSTSAYDLHGGGGGGGGGTDSGIGGPGGIGGISAGGTSGSTATRDGHPPSPIVATGAGGGAGGWMVSGFMGDAGNGAFPGGGGGGGRGASSATNGGAGAAAIMFIIEHLA